MRDQLQQEEQRERQQQQNAAMQYMQQRMAGPPTPTQAISTPQHYQSMQVPVEILKVSEAPGSDCYWPAGFNLSGQKALANIVLENTGMENYNDFFIWWNSVDKKNMCLLDKLTYQENSFVDFIKVGGWFVNTLLSIL